MTTVTATPYEADDELRLRVLGLSSAIIHDGLRRGSERAANRSAVALASSPGTDIYHDGMEDLAQLLQDAGWQPVRVDGQPRLLHPAGLMSFSVSSGVNVGKSNLRRPRTNPKGPATRNSLGPAVPHPSLFDDLDADLAAARSETANRVPFYFLLCERMPAGTGVALELSRPTRMTAGGNVSEWGERINVQYLNLTEDLPRVDEPGDDEFDVPVEPR